MVDFKLNNLGELFHTFDHHETTVHLSASDIVIEHAVNPFDLARRELIQAGKLLKYL